MSDLIKAADDIRIFAAKVKGFVSVAEAIEKIGSFDQAAKDAEARKNKAYEAEVKAVKSLEVAEADLKLAHGKIAEAEEKSALIEQTAHARANTIIAEAHAKSDAVLAEGVAKKAKLASDVIEARAELGDLMDKIEQAKADLQVIKAQKEEVKKQLSAFLK